MTYSQPQPRRSHQSDQQAPHFLLYLPPALAASLSISSFFLLCISSAFSLILPTSCVLGKPISQYPGGVAARAHVCRCLEMVFLCDSILERRRAALEVLGEVRLSIRSRPAEAPWRGQRLLGEDVGERHRGCWRRFGRGPTFS